MSGYRRLIRHLRKHDELRQRVHIGLTSVFGMDGEEAALWITSAEAEAVGSPRTGRDTLRLAWDRKLRGREQAS